MAACTARIDRHDGLPLLEVIGISRDRAIDGFGARRGNQEQIRVEKTFFPFVLRALRCRERSLRSSCVNNTCPILQRSRQTVCRSVSSGGFGQQPRAICNSQAGSVGRRRIPRASMPAPIAPEVTKRLLHDSPGAAWLIPGPVN